jgi:hypothetical protein
MCRHALHGQTKPKLGLGGMILLASSSCIPVRPRAPQEYEPAHLPEAFTEFVDCFSYVLRCNFDAALLPYGL